MAALAILVVAGCGTHRQSSMPAQPVINQPSQSQINTAPSIGQSSQWTQAKSLVSQAADAAKAGNSSEAYSLLVQARSVLGNTRLINAGDQSWNSLTTKFDQALDSIRNAPENGREVTAIAAQQLQDAFGALDQAQGH